MPVSEPRLCLRCSPHEDSALCVAFSAFDSSQIASGGEDGALLLHDIRRCSLESSSTSTSSSSKTSFDDPVAALSWQSEHALYVGSGKKVHLVDIRNIQSSSSSPFPLVFEAEDDVSSLSVCRDDKTLAVADDSGAVTLVDLSGAGRSSFTIRKLPSAHGESVATSCCFRPNRSGESLVSGGCDCTLARWDCSSKRLVRRWQASELVEAQQTGGELAEGQQQSTRLFNPPFVHSLAVPTPHSSFASNSKKPWNAIVAAAVGDGSVVVLDCDASPSATDASRQRKSPQQQKKKKEEAPFEGVLAVLRQEDGGHSTAATCVTFVDNSESGASIPPPVLLASGGDDGRVIFWRWAEKAAARGASSSTKLPLSWSSSLAPFVQRGDEGDSEFRFLAAATPRGAKLQGLASSKGLVAAADTSEVVKLYRLE